MRTQSISLPEDHPLNVFSHLLQAHNQKLVTLASILLVVYLSLTIADAVLFTIDNMTQPSVTSQSAGQVQSSSQSKKGRKVDLAALNLFGKVEAEAVPQIVDAPETKLNLELQGVFAAADDADSTAIVAERNKDGELYHIGDRLPGNAILSAVFQDHILIRRGSKTEKLLFSDSKLRLSAGASAGTQANTANRLQQVRERITQRNPNRARPVSGPNQKRITNGASLREYIDSNKQKFQKDPQAMLSQIGMSAVSQGNAKGYRVDSSAAQMSQAGLKAGDVVLSVNGIPVGNAVNDTALIDQVMSSKRARIEVQRDTRRFFLTVPIPGQ